MGHLSRAAIIAGGIREQGWKTFLIHKDDELASSFLRSRDIESILLDPECTMEGEMLEVREIALASPPASLVIADVLENDVHQEYMKCLRGFKAPLFAITDDSFKREIDADVVFNGNPNQEGIVYHSQNTLYLTGPRYFIMDPRYGFVKSKEPGALVSTILISMGGSDHNNYLFRILDALKELKDIRLHIISSSATGYREQLMETLKTYPLQTEVKFDIPSLINEWALCDMAITAAGNTLFERIAARLPGMTICQLKRQNEIADQFDRSGVNINLGMGDEYDFSGLAKAVQRFSADRATRTTQYQLSAATVDGKGLERLIQEINKRLQS